MAERGQVGVAGTADRLAPFGTTIFTEMTRLATQHGAVNLAQGFPDFDGPAFVRDAAAAAIARGENQYARMYGIPALNRAIAAWYAGWADAGARLTLDPETQITVTSGCTEAIAATMLGLVNPGDAVILFEPYYDSYRACVSMAGGVARFVTLRPPAGGGVGRGEFTFDEGELRRAFAGGARAILVNTPHNPTGKVFARDELELIARLCIEHGTVAITDEVYECLTFDADRPHVRLAALPGMATRTVTLSSLGKTFSLTGWKVGWAAASEELTRAVRSAHQFLTFATATPFQHAAGEALDPSRSGGRAEAAIRELVAHLRWARDYLGGALERLGFGVYHSAGTYFLMADHSRFGFPDDAAFCRHLTEKVGVAAIPPSAFYERREHGRRLARFAFCKKRETLERAVERLERLR